MLAFAYVYAFIPIYKERKAFLVPPQSFHANDFISRQIAAQTFMKQYIQMLAQTGSRHHSSDHTVIPKLAATISLSRLYSDFYPIYSDFSLLYSDFSPPYPTLHSA